MCPWTIPLETHPAALAVRATTAGLTGSRIKLLISLCLCSLSGGHALSPVVETFSHPQPPDFCSPCIWKDNATTPGHTLCSRPWLWLVCAGTSNCVIWGCLSFFAGLIFSHFSSLICLLLGLVRARPSSKETAGHTTVLSSSSLHFRAVLLAALTACRELKTVAWSGIPLTFTLSLSVANLHRPPLMEQLML